MLIWKDTQNNNKKIRLEETYESKNRKTHSL